MSGGLRFGASYTPSRGWFHSWLDLDLDEVRRDMDSLAELGLDHVRVLPMWELLQPNRTLIRAAAVADVVAVVDAAAAAGLDATVDVLQGHLSSFDFLPSWVLSWHRRDIFTDPEVVAAQERLVATLGLELAGRPTFLGLTLGNETNQFAKSRHPDPQPLDPAGAGRWLDRLLRVAARSAPGGRHTHSFDDDVWFVDDSVVTPTHAVTLGDLTTVHSWVFTGVAAHFPPGHPAYGWFARYLLELAAAWGGPGRGTWLQEVGAPVPHLGAGEVERFAARTLRTAAGHGRLWGVTWWCSHDVDRALADFPELEHTLGLLGSDRSVKPLGRVVAEVVAELRAARPVPVPVPQMVLPCEDGTVRRSATAPGSPFFADWVEAAAAGAPPRIVLPDGAVPWVQGVDGSAR
ncbi:MAG TPA: glycosyl hydrolase [Cellulomonas sp.]